MAAARKRSVPYDRQVFLNCPFDDEYYPPLRAAVFTIHACQSICVRFSQSIELAGRRAVPSSSAAASSIAYVQCAHC